MEPIELKVTSLPVDGGGDLALVDVEMDGATYQIGMDVDGISFAHWEKDQCGGIPWADLIALFKERCEKGRAE